MRNLLRILIGCSVVGALIGSGNSQGTGSTKLPSFSIQILLPQTTVKSGSEIKLKIVLINVSDREIYVRHEKGAARGEFSYDIEVRDDQGRSPTETKYYRSIKGKDSDQTTVVLSAPGLLSVKPGEALHDEAVLNKLFDLSVPGKYTISVQRVDEASKIAVRSNTLTVTIAP